MHLGVYKCNVCGNMVEMIHKSFGQLVCCGKNMVLLQENIEDASLEKHVPVIAEDGAKIKVSVGSIPHPMEEKHYIEWIELIADEKAYRQFLKPGQAPEAVFEINPPVNKVTIREYCNLHGLWKTEK